MRLPEPHRTKHEITIMKLFSYLLQTSRHMLRLLALVPLLAASVASHAEEDIDGRHDGVEFSQAELDQILAPIALYPDTILSQVLIAATYPIEVVQAARWSSNNSSAKGADAVAKVEDKDWDPSVKALVAFPDILQRMSDDIDWTQKLGDAFLSSEERVMDSIQSLRNKAYASGSLNKVKHLKVERENEQIIIEPAEERIVYVPVYDTRVVYGNWWWPEYPPVYWHHPTSYIHISGFYWGPSIFIGPSLFYSSCHWHSRRVVVVDRHYSHGSRPVFYTGRSIVHYQNARPWRHEPVHRRGVAYYNNDLRTRYGSQRESYRDARTYREERREDRRGQQAPRQRSFNENNYTPPRNLTVDRSEQLRERMSQRHDSTSPRTPERDRTRSDENRNRAAGPSPQSNARDSSDKVPRQQAIKNSIDHPGRLENPGLSRSPQNEQEVRARLRSERETQDSNDLGATRPTLIQPDRSQSEQEQRVRETSDRAKIEGRNREIQNDSRSTRQTFNERSEQRPQRAEQSQPRQERSFRQESQPRGNNRSEEDRPVRANRAL